jgi:hypothetical protein
MTIDPRLAAAGIWGAAFLLHRDPGSGEARSRIESGIAGGNRWPKLPAPWDQIDGTLTLPQSTSPATAAALMDEWLDADATIQRALTQATDDSGAFGLSGIVDWTRQLDHIDDRRSHLRLVARPLVAAEIIQANGVGIDPSAIDSPSWETVGRAALRDYLLALIDAVDQHAIATGSAISFADAMGATLEAGVGLAGDALRGAAGLGGDLIAALFSDVIVLGLVGVAAYLIVRRSL